MNQVLLSDIKISIKHKSMLKIITQTLDGRHVLDEYLTPLKISRPHGVPVHHYILSYPKRLLAICDQDDRIDFIGNNDFLGTEQWNYVNKIDNQWDEYNNVNFNVNVNVNANINKNKNYIFHIDVNGSIEYLGWCYLIAKAMVIPKYELLALRYNMSTLLLYRLDNKLHLCCKVQPTDIIWVYSNTLTCISQAPMFDKGIVKGTNNDSLDKSEYPPNKFNYVTNRKITNTQAINCENPKGKSTNNHLKIFNLLKNQWINVGLIRQDKEIKIVNDEFIVYSCKNNNNNKNVNNTINNYTIFRLAKMCNLSDCVDYSIPLDYKEYNGQFGIFLSNHADVNQLNDYVPSNSIQLVFIDNPDDLRLPLTMASLEFKGELVMPQHSLILTMLKESISKVTNLASNCCELILSYLFIQEYLFSPIYIQTHHCDNKYWSSAVCNPTQYINCLLCGSV